MMLFLFFNLILPIKFQIHLHTMHTFLQVNHLSVIYNQQQILDDISFEMMAGAHYGLAGANGSGKSSLLKAIAGLLQPSSGNILFKGKKVIGADEQLIPGHRNIIYLSQQFELRSHYRVYELLEMAAILDGPHLVDIAALCRVTNLLQRNTAHLSGGEKQRVAIAIALMKKPALLLLDEPFSNADAIHKNLLEEMLFDVRNKLSQSYILVSHCSTDLLAHCETIILMDKGAIIQAGTPEHIYRHPINAYAAGISGVFSILTPAFCAAVNLRTKKDKQVLARPDAFTIHNRQTSLQGKVEQVQYMGLFYMAKIRCIDCVIDVCYQHPQIFKNDIVYLSADPHKFFYNYASP